MPIQRLQAETSSTDFYKWMRYLKQTHDEPSMTHYYLMQIAMTFARQNMSKAESSKVKLDDFLLTSSKPKKRLTLAEYTRRSKAFFASLIGKKQNG